MSRNKRGIVRRQECHDRRHLLRSCHASCYGRCDIEAAVGLDRLGNQVNDLVFFVDVSDHSGRFETFSPDLCGDGIDFRAAAGTRDDASATPSELNCRRSAARPMPELAPVTRTALPSRVFKGADMWAVSSERGVLRAIRFMRAGSDHLRFDEFEDLRASGFGEATGA